MNVQNIPILT
uniref:Uncharacterized protein n=1 Tax=Anguilla anguilla TaxID=7936 RepID=A0A0E9W5I7_ANGAN